MDGTGRLTAVNKAAEHFSGYSRVELIGKSVFDLLTRDGADTARTMLAEGSPRGNWTEFEIIKRDGTPGLHRSERPNAAPPGTGGRVSRCRPVT